MGMAYKANDVRRYFHGLSVLAKIAWFFIIFVFLGLSVLGIVAILALLGMQIHYHFIGRKKTEDMIDAFLANEFKMLEKRADNKLNLVMDPSLQVDPVFVHGPSYDPASVRSGRWKAKMGTDKKLRYSLMEFTTFKFDEMQMYIYFAHVNLATGGIFHEGTIECFYSDINGITTDQVKTELKLFLRKEKRMFENISVLANGYSHVANYTSSLDDPSLVEKFTAMRNLVRERKNDSAAS
jgi:hypothetical protein